MDAAWKLATDPTTRQWMRDKASVVKYRNYNDPFMQAMIRDPFSSKGAMDRVSAVGGAPMQFLDKISAAATWLAAYQRELQKLSIKYDSPTKMPVVEAAVNKANTITRITQASHEFKDVPQALSAGTLTGNRSVDRVLLQFQSYPLTQWAAVNHAVKQALAFNKPSIATKYITWFLLATLAESGIRYGYWEGYNKLTSKQEDENAKRKFFETFLRNTIQNVPFGGHGDAFVDAASDQIGEIVFDRKGKSRPVASESPLIPFESSFLDVKRGTRLALEGKKGGTKAKGAITAASGLASMFGIPGAATAADIAKLAIRQNQKPKKDEFEKLADSFR